MSALISPARMQARPTAASPKTQQAYSWASPTRGMIANGNIGVSQPGSAYFLENWFCTATGIIIRRGKLRYATLGDGDLPVRSIFSYVSGNINFLFAANDEFIYNISSVSEPYNGLLVDEDGDYIVDDLGNYIGSLSTGSLSIYPNISGKWIVIQTQASDGTAYLIGVNGADYSFVYNGQEFNPQVENGVFKLLFDAQTSPFTIGQTVIGGTSGATGLIIKLASNAGSGTLWVKDITGGPFQDNEALSDGTGGAATANGINNIIGGTNVTFTGDPGLDTSDLSYVWSYKNRLFLVQKDTLNAWYGAAGAISGELTVFSLGGQFSLGGHLVMGAKWSRDTGSGLQAMCTFFSSEGEVAVYQGANPGDAADWQLVGVYRIGRPLGAKAMIDAGGDLIVATDAGLVPLSVAVNTDYSVLGTKAISENIIDLWNQEVDLRANADWSAVLWSKKQMVAVALPTTNDQPPRWLVANAKTGAWSIYSGWDSTCMHVYRDQLMFGDTGGGIYQAEQSGLDDRLPYTATCLLSFDQMGMPGYKTTSMLRAVFRSPNAVKEKIVVRTDYNDSIPPVPSATPIPIGSTWGDAVWGESAWSAPNSQKNIYQFWRAEYGGGEVHAPLIQITSGANVPVDAELIRVDGIFTSGEVVV